MTAVACQVGERLGHERRELVALLRHDVDHVAEEDRAIARDEDVVVLEVRLELAVRVLVVVRVVPPAEAVDVLRERRQELVVPVQRLRVVARLVGRVERVVHDEPAVLVLAHEEELGLEPDLHAIAELGRAVDRVAQDRARAVEPRLALDRDVTREPSESVLPRHLRVRADVGDGEHVGRRRALAHRAGGEPREPCALGQHVVDRLDRHELGARLAVHVDELRQEELDAVVLGAPLYIVVRHHRRRLQYVRSTASGPQ